MDLSDYEDESWDGINLDNAINDIVTNYAIGEGAEVGAYGDTFDFTEEVGDRIESGVLSIGAGMMAFPKLLADTKAMIAKTGEDLGIPEGAMNVLGTLSSIGTFGLGDVLTHSDLVAAGESAYEKFSKKSNDLNVTLMDFGRVGMAETLGEAFIKYEKDDQGKFVLDKNGEKIVVEQSLEKRLGAFITGASRITSSALGSLPSVSRLRK